MTDIIELNIFLQSPYYVLNQRLSDKIVIWKKQLRLQRDEINLGLRNKGVSLNQALLNIAAKYDVTCQRTQSLVPTAELNDGSKHHNTLTLGFHSNADPTFGTFKYCMYVDGVNVNRMVIF